MAISTKLANPLGPRFFALRRSQTALRITPGKSPLARGPAATESPMLPLLLQTRADRLELASRAELLIFVRDKIGVSLHEHFPGRAEVEFSRLIPEKFAVDASPDQ